MAVLAAVTLAAGASAQDKASDQAATPEAATAPAADPKAEPAKAEPAKAEPAKTEPAKTEPAKAEPAKTEPAKTEPAKTEPTKAEPTKAEPAADAPAPAAGAAPAPPGVHPTTSPEAEAVWRSYEQRWAETEDYSAGFRQVIEVPDVGSRIESAGRFFFAKPGLVRWDYVEGPPQTVVGDGTWIWLYQPDLEQVYKIPYAQAFGRGGLVELLAGREGVSERYRTSIVRPDEKTVRIHLKSLVEGGGDLEVTLEADTFDLRGVIVHDAAGSTTSMTFAEPRRNQGADLSRFTFTPPPSVDIITDNGAGF